MFICWDTSWVTSWNFINMWKSTLYSLLIFNTLYPKVSFYHPKKSMCRFPQSFLHYLHVSEDKPVKHSLDKRQLIRCLLSGTLKKWWLSQCFHLPCTETPSQRLIYGYSHMYVVNSDKTFAVSETTKHSWILKQQCGNTISKPAGTF